MSLALGTRVGPYEITGQIGAGGMGEVYRATDTNLGRQVAIKVLPDAIAHDPERVARFEREARTLATLNHPNIAIVHGFEKGDGVRALVMELVEGPTLADHLAHGALPVDEALPIARQIAEALEAAHEQGIVHRDLKPANIKVREDGTVKVLDFGLAKALETAPHSSDASQSPTITSPAMTRMGVILGTAAYMSPEQARGKPVDKRVDIWAFGCVLFEMLTGKRAFDAGNVSEVLAGVIKSEPNWGALPADVPPTVHTYLRSCLQKDPKHRVRDIGDVRLALEGALDTAPSVLLGTAPNRKLSLWQRPLPVTVFALSLALVTGMAVWRIREPGPRVPTRLAVALPTTPSLTLDAVGVLTLSPDGQTLVYVGGTGPQRRLYVRRFDRIEVLPIGSTEGAADPFFSPDGQWVGFAAASALKKVRLAGGPPETVCPLSSTFRGGSWGANDVILFGMAQSGLWQVAGTGGEAKPVTTLAAGELEHRTPDILPGEKAAVFTIWPGEGSLLPPQIGVVLLGETGQHRALLDGRTPRYATTGHLVFQGGLPGEGLSAVAFDLGRLDKVGEPVQVVERVISGALGGGAPPAWFSKTADGTLVYVTGAPNPERTLVSVDRNGNATPIVEAKARYLWPRFSPDGRHIAVTIAGTLPGALGSMMGEIWICEVARKYCSRLASDGGYPVWTRDGRFVAFNFLDRLAGDVDLYWKRSDGSGDAEPLLIRPGIQFPFSWSLDDRLLAFNEPSPTGAELDLRLLAQEKSEVSPLLVTSFDERMAVFSPDGRWFAYQSLESGRWEVYVRPYPGPGGREPVSTGGGRGAVWSRDGRELFYREDNRLMVVRIDPSSPTFKAGVPRRLFEGHDIYFAVAGTNYDVSPDGQQFVMVQGDSVPELRLVLNWHEELKRLVPTK